MAFDLLSRFRRPVPSHDPRGQQRVQRPPPMIHVQGKRPAAVAQVRPHVRRVHQHHPAPAAIPRAPVPARKGPVVRAPPPARKGPLMRQPARPHPPQRGSSKLLQCLHIHFHPSQKRDLALPPPRSSKHPSQQAPPFPPPRGAIKPPPRHVHWAPAQASLPSQPYPYPSHPSCRASSHATSHARITHYPGPPSIPRYQPPQQLPQPSRDLVVSRRRR